MGLLVFKVAAEGPEVTQLCTAEGCICLPPLLGFNQGSPGFNNGPTEFSECHTCSHLSCSAAVATQHRRLHSPAGSSHIL